MSIGEIIKSFNDIMCDFLQQVSPLIGSTYHHYFTKLIKANATMPIQYFNYYIYETNEDLENKILNKDESYFMNTDNHKEHIKNAEKVVPLKGYDNNLMEIMRLQNIYTQLSPESKENVWDILQALLALSKEYLKLKK